MAWVKGKGMNFKKTTAALENIATFFAWLVCISGMVAHFYRRFGNYDWKSGRVKIFLCFHKVIARIYCVGI